MCIRNLRLGLLSRFIREMRSLRSAGAIAILSMGGRLFVAGWIWRLYHATGDGCLFNYPVHLSRFGNFLGIAPVQTVPVMEIRGCWTGAMRMWTSENSVKAKFGEFFF